ncbi:hypothetical protein MJ560_07865 [Klebsiella pneumoniae]|nr:hypothetical protein MJ560_07865 [Klebsiella pneumoniae]
MWPKTSPNDSVARDLESGRIDGATLSGMTSDHSAPQQPQGKEFALFCGHLQDDTPDDMLAPERR